MELNPSTELNVDLETPTVGVDPTFFHLDRHGRLLQMSSLGFVCSSGAVTGLPFGDVHLQSNAIG